MRHPIIPGTVVLDRWELAEIRRRAHIRNTLPSKAILDRYRKDPKILARVTARHIVDLKNAEDALVRAKGSERARIELEIAALRERLDDWTARAALIRAAIEPAEGATDAT